MKKLLLILLCLPMIGFGQGWSKTFGGTGIDKGYSVQQTTDGGYIVAGKSNGDVYLIKTDGNGDSLWTKTFDGGVTGGAGGYSVQQTTDDGYIIAGERNQKIYLIKTDGNGDSLWTKLFEDSIGAGFDDRGYSVQQTTDGGYIITGSSRNLVPWLFTPVTFLIKTDGSGTEQWTKTFSGIGAGCCFDEGYSVQQTTDGGYIITGKSKANGNGYEYYLIKTNGSGIEQWRHTWSLLDVGHSVQQTTDGGYIITGMTSFGTSDDVFLLKTDGSGVMQWYKTFGGTGIDKARSVQQTTDGGYIITGSSTGAGNFDVILIKTDGNGCTSSVIWQQAFSICYGDSVIVGNSIYDTTGNYTDTLITPNSCDSIVYTNISITPVIWQQAFSICYGDSVIVGNSIYDTTGVYTDTLATTNGCDNIVYTSITMDYNTSSFDTLSVTASIVWNGMPLNVSGDYSVTLINSVGCDSIANFNLTITNTTGLLDVTNTEKPLLKIIDILGRETKGTKNEVLFYIYDDGTVEKRIVIE